MAHLSANCVHDFSTLRNHRVYRGVCGGRARGYRGRRRHSPPVRFAAGRHGCDGSAAVACFTSFLLWKIYRKKTITVTSNDDDDDGDSLHSPSVVAFHSPKGRHGVWTLLCFRTTESIMINSAKPANVVTFRRAVNFSRQCVAIAQIDRIGAGKFELSTRYIWKKATFLYYSVKKYLFSYVRRQFFVVGCRISEYEPSPNPKFRSSHGLTIFF